MAITQKINVRPLIKHVMRQLAPSSNPAMGYQTGAEIDADLSSLVMQGYRVINTHYLGVQNDPSNHQPYYGILYILALEQSEVERARQEARKSEG